MTETMRAIEITEPGGPDVLQGTTRPRPQPKHGQVIIKVAYAGVNRPDALQRAGKYAPPATASDLPGLEASGEVVEVGPGVTTLAPGIWSAPCCPAAAMPNMWPPPPRIACRSPKAWG